MLKGHDRRTDRNAAFTLDRHPVRTRSPALTARLDLARHLDRAAEQQQLFGQSGFAGIRMRDDRKGAPARDLVGERRHYSWVGQLRSGTSADEPGASALYVVAKGLNQSLRPVEPQEISFCSRWTMASALLSGVKVAVNRPSGFIT